MAQQIDLVFGVAGGGTPSGISGRKIKNQLDNILGNLNAKGFGVNIKKLVATQDSINNLKAQIESQLSALNVKVKFDGAAGSGGSVVTSIGNSATEAKVQIDALNGSLTGTSNVIRTAVVSDVNNGTEEIKKLTETVKLANGALQTVDVKTNKDGGTSVTKTVVNNYEQQAKAAEKAAAREQAAREKTEKAAKQAIINEQKSITSTNKILAKAYSSRDMFSGIQDYPEILQKYNTVIKNISEAARKKGYLDKNEVSFYANEISKAEIAARNAGLAVDTFGEKLNKVFLGKFRELIAFNAFSIVIANLKKIYTNVVDIDTAMTELRKVTQATSQEYAAFLDNAGDRAKNLGTSLKEVINATADYARLGNNINDASYLADTALIYRNVGDDVNDIDTATEHLISTLKGFNLEASDAMKIVDIFNEVSNNYAVSAGDIGEGLQRSSAAMAAAGNSLEQTVAIFTAANTIQQNAEVTGTALKTMSARLRASKTELEDMGEDTDGLATSTSKLRKEIKQLTGVDIMVNANTFKSTYDMLDELSQVWDKLDDITQSNVLELLFGKRQASIGAGLLENFDIARDALGTALNSAGSAQRELDKYLESIQGHISQLTASWEVFSANFLDTNLVKGIVDLLRVLVEFLNELTERFGALGIIAPAALTAIILNFKEISSFINGIGMALPMILEEIDKGAKLAAAAGETLDAITEQGRVISAASMKWAKILAFIKTNLGAISAIAAVAALTITAIVTTDPRKNAEDLEKINKEYQETQDNIEKLNSDIEKNKKEISERQKLIDSGKGTFIDQEELDNLRRENELLNAQLETEKAIAEQRKQERLSEIKTSANGNGVLFGIFENDFWDFGKNRGYNSNGFAIAGVDYWDSLANLQEGINKYQKLVAEGEGTKKTGNFWDWNETNASKLADLKTKYSQVYADLIEWRNVLVTETGDEEAQLIVEAIDRAIFNSQLKASEKIGSLADDPRFKELFDKVYELDTSDYSEDVLQSLVNKETYDAFKAYLDEAGLSVKDFFDFIKGAKKDAEEIIDGNDFVTDTAALEEATEKVQKLSASFKTLADAFKEQNQYGQLSIDTALDIIDAGYAAALQIDKETGAIRLNKEAYVILANAKIAEQMVTLQTARAEAIHNLELARTQKESRETINSILNLISAYDAEIAVLNGIDVSKITTGLYDIGSAADYAKTKLSKLSSGMNTLLDQTIAMLKKEADLAEKAETEAIENQIEALEDAKDAAKDRWDTEKEALEDTLDAYEKIID